MFNCQKIFALITLFVLLSSITFAQKSADSTQTGFAINHYEKSEADSTRRKQALKQAQLKKLQYQQDRVWMEQDAVLEEIKRNTLIAKNFLKSGLDTAGTKKELQQINKWYLLAIDGIFTHTGTAQTYRNLVTSTKVLSVLSRRAQLRKVKLDQYQKQLVSLHSRLDSLSSNEVLYQLPADERRLKQFIVKNNIVAIETMPVDSALESAIENVQHLQALVNFQVYTLNARMENIDIFQNEISNKAFEKEFPYLWEKAKKPRSFEEIFKYSMGKGWLLLYFYTQNNAWLIGFVLLLVIACTVYLNSLKKIYINNKLLTKNFEGQLVLRRPFLSALVIVLSIFQFLFYDPPFIFNAIFWITASLSLTIIFRRFISTYWFKVWLSFTFLFLLSCANDLILQASRTERWGILLIGTIGFLLGIFVFVTNHKKELKEQWILYAIGLMTILEFVAVMANIGGRFNLSKTLLTSGYLNVVIAILFLWTVRLINEGLYLAFNVYTTPDKRLFYVNFEKVGKKAPAFFYLLLVVGWVILFGRNFYAFKKLTEPLLDFAGQPHRIGSYVFSINSLLLFFLIMTIAVVTSKIVSYFASDRPHGDDQEQKTGIGSWILLVRITIISIGLFLAFAAAGIAMDRITLVLGALGVGIGFGLQTLVNNLVSGLIIAFEKPVNVGDIVEIGTKGGTMKSIGFRSSVVATWDGADLVIPNGDLLNSHLVNWTLGGNRKRIDVIVGVAYGTDLEKVKVILNEILANDERILKIPQPVVLFQDFSESFVEIKALFWVRYFKDALVMRSDLILAINNQFNKAGIVIPFAQQDVYIHQVKE
jgi:potassium efflux system protein